MSPEGRFALFTQATCALLDESTVDLRHARRRRAGPWGKREDMQLRHHTLVKESEGTTEHALILGWKAGDNIGAEDNTRTQAAHLFTKGDRIAARMPPLHALEDKVIARLQR